MKMVYEEETARQLTLEFHESESGSTASTIEAIFLQELPKDKEGEKE